MLGSRMSDAPDEPGDAATPGVSVAGRVARHEERPRGHRASVFVLVLVFLLIVSGAVAAVRHYTWCGGAGGSHDPVSFDVAKGATGDVVAGDLAEAGVTRCGGVVGNMLMARSGRASEIRAGSYDLTTGMTLDAALDVLTAAPVAVPTVQITIPEGYRLTQIAERVAQDLKLPAKRFLDVAQSGDLALPPYLPKGTATAEGFLFPKTYDFVKADVTPESVAERMLEQFATEAQDLDLIDGAKALGYTPYEIVTVASMVEREAVVDADRAKIAAVIYNRLDAGMTLGIDATLLYDDPTPDGQLSASDLKVDSPYNTRINGGLPPTPIASPGAASLEAALHPADVPFLYYVLCGADGHHVFSVGYDEFLANVDRCLG
jgi:uncharacterized YceG family protein